MSLELSGTTPAIKGVAGSVSAPALTGDDADTGISFPSANTIKFSTGGVERMSITDSGVTGTGIGAGKIVQVKSVSKLDTFSVPSPTINQYYDVTGLNNLQITTTGSNKVIVFMSVYLGLQASGYTGYMRGIRTTSGSVTNLSYPSSSDASNEASAATVAGSNTSTNKSTHALHIVGFEDSPGAGTHQYGIQVASRNATTFYTGRPYSGTDASNLVVTPSGTITLYEVEA